MGAATERFAKPCRSAIELVTRALAERPESVEVRRELFASRRHAEPGPELGAAPELLARAAVAGALVARCLRVERAEDAIVRFEDWFVGADRSVPRVSALLPYNVRRVVTERLNGLSGLPALAELLPYVLEPHGPLSRQAVETRPAAATARRAKRGAGVYYTPSDVADFIVRECVPRPANGIPPRVLDPACGSGVFLRAALRHLVPDGAAAARTAAARACLFGVDIDPRAVEAACFVLLLECGGGAGGETPWRVWHRLRSNFYRGDALTLEVGGDPGEAPIPPDASFPDRPPPAAEAGPAMPFEPATRLGEILPGVAAGADVVVGNPPYAVAGERSDAGSLECRFASFRPGRVATQNVYPAFLEMTRRLARPGGTGGMVVPLSIAFSARGQFAACRRVLIGGGGRWRFAFFDREPHALFGEEAKVRCAIVLRGPGGPSVETGPLRRWTSRERPRLFEAVTFTPLRRRSPGAIIPKLNGAAEAELHHLLRGRDVRLEGMCDRLAARRPAEAADGDGAATVYVAGTAYNFLNVFRPHCSLPTPRAPWSASPLHALTFSDESAAAVAFAVLASRLTYWLWRAEGDGFHVTRRFVAGLPFDSTSFVPPDRARLAELGGHLWTQTRAGQFLSLNGGRQTVGYRPPAPQPGDAAEQVDAILLRAVGIDPAFRERLARYASTGAAASADEG